MQQWIDATPLQTITGTLTIALGAYYGLLA
jgi:hypothetical protein